MRKTRRRISKKSKLCLGALVPPGANGPALGEANQVLGHENDTPSPNQLAVELFAGLGIFAMNPREEAQIYSENRRFQRGTSVAPACVKPPVVLPRKAVYLADVDGNGSYLAMLKRFTSLILALVIGGSVLAGTALLHDEHVCKMAGLEAMPGMETMPCCEKDETQSVSSESGSPGQCCVTIPQETGSSGTSFNLRPPSFSIAVIHPAVAQSPLAAPKPYECSHSTEVFLPNLQASYIRNLSLLI